MEINNTDIVSIFGKLGGKNSYNVHVNFNYKLSRVLFGKIVSRFIYDEDKGGMGSKYEMKTRLEVRSDKVDYSVYVDGKDSVKRLWQFGELPEVPYRLYDNVETFVVDKYGLSFNLIGLKEKEVDKEWEKIMGDEKEMKEYYLRNVYEILEKEYGFKVNLMEERVKESGKDFRGSIVLGQVPEYKLEIVLPHDMEMDEEDKFLDYFGRFLRWLLEELEETPFLITVNDKNNLMKSYRKLVRRDEMLSVEPVEVLRRNFHRKGNFEYVRENYAMSYMIDGELRLLFVADSFSDAVDGVMFMMTSDGNFVSTGRKVKGFENSLLEGYYKDGLYYITDVIFYKGNDVRKSVFYKMGGGGKDKYRFDYLMQFYREGVQAGTYVNQEQRDEATKVVVAKYLFGSGDVFDDNVNEMFEKINLQDFVVSGLMFRPMDKPYPERSGNWYSLMKWNYPEYRLGEFLVRYEKIGMEDKVSPFQLPSKGKDLEGKVIKYKTLNLKVGGIRDAGNKKIITIVDYLPRGTDPDADINKANIPLTGYGQVVANDLLSGVVEEIEDNSVVMFVYQRIYGEYTNLFKWTPVRVNHLKTKMVREGKVSCLISENYGNHLWNALSNGITELQLREGNVPEEDLSHLYYAANNSMRLKKYPFQIFHNRVVKDKLIMEASPAIIRKSGKMEGSLLDLAAGSGGDTLKWKLGKLKDVVGIEIVRESVETARDLYRKTKGVKPNITYIWGDSGRLIFPDFEAALDGFNKGLMKKTILSKYMFDIVSMQFAIHYLFEDEIKLRTFLQNVSDNLRIGGYFIGTSMDGKRVFDLLKGVKKPVEGMVGDDLLWRIDKRYDIKTWDSKKPMLGHKVEVFVSTIGIPHEEYLVNYDYLEKLCKEYGLKMEFVRGFGSIYGEYEGGEYEKDLKMMSDGEKVFSFLHNEFRFVKEKDASDNVYKKLVDMVEKRRKKEEKGKKFVGGEKRMVLKLRSDKK